MRRRRLLADRSEALSAERRAHRPPSCVSEPAIASIWSFVSLSLQRVLHPVRSLRGPPADRPQPLAVVEQQQLLAVIVRVSLDGLWRIGGSVQVVPWMP